MEELFLFIFPDHDLALKAEKKRLRIIAERVKRVNSYIREHHHGKHAVELMVHQLGTDEEIIKKMRRTSIMGASNKIFTPSASSSPSPSGTSKSIALSNKEAQAALAATLIASMPPIAQSENERCVVTVFIGNQLVE